MIVKENSVCASFAQTTTGDYNFFLLATKSIQDGRHNSGSGYTHNANVKFGYAARRAALLRMDKKNGRMPVLPLRLF